MTSTIPISPETVTRTTLGNGLVVLVRQNTHNPSVTLRGRLLAGALYDSEKTSGLAHFSTAALQRGTRRRSFQKLNAELDRAGMSFGVGAGMETVGFGGKALVEDFHQLLALSADVLRNPIFPREETEKLRSELLTDLKEADQDTQTVAYREFRRLCYSAEHPYHRLSDGNFETMRRLPIDVLRAFHRRHFRPDRMSIVIVGDIAPERAIEEVNQVFGDWFVEGPPSPHSIPEAPAPDKIRRIESPLPGKTQLDLVLGFLGLRRTDPEYYAMSVGDLIFGRLGLYGRLGANVRDKQGLAYYVYSGLEANLGAGPWAIHAGVNPKNLDAAIDGILAQVSLLSSQVVTRDELDEAMDYITGSLALRLETNDGVAATLSDIELFDLGLDFLQRYPNIIRGITPERILEAVRKLALPGRYVLSIAGPLRGE